VLIELNDIRLCADLFHSAFEHYSQRYPLGHLVDQTTGAVLPGGGFGLMELLALADMHNSLGEHDRAVRVIRSGVRWLQGRQDQRFWDPCEDDREYDVDAGRPTEQGPGELAPGRYPLDVNARHRLAVARIRMQEFEEGAVSERAAFTEAAALTNSFKMHAQIVIQQDVLLYAPLFHEIADAYFDRQMYAEAKPIYEILGRDAGVGCPSLKIAFSNTSDPQTSSLDVLIQVARCHHMLGELKDAVEVYEAGALPPFPLSPHRPSVFTVIAADPSANDAKMRLAEIYEVLNDPRKALDLVYQGTQRALRNRRIRLDKQSSH
jgi:general transcription factor 3C polypeptide 3 (transcription factor C subunit 4)